MALLLADIGYGNYISPVKLGVFVAMFFVWLPLVGWIYLDAKAVKTKELLWTGLIFVAGAAATLIWLLLPVFAVGATLYASPSAQPASAISCTATQK